MRVALLLSILLLALPLSAAPPRSLISPTVPEGFGVHIPFTEPEPGEMERFREAGYHWARVDLFWNRVEREKGIYDFTAYDRLLDHLGAAGVRPIFVLDFANDLYQSGAPSRREAQEAFVRFAAAAARRFQGKGVVFEVGNEPNLPASWPPAPDPEAYARLAAAAAKAIHGADREAQVVGPGVIGFPWEFLTTLFRAGLLEHLDGVSVHPHRNRPPESAANDFVRLRTLIARYAPESKRTLPILSSAWGYSTAETHGVSEPLQAAYLVRQWLANLASGVSLSLFYSWRDAGDDPRNVQHRFGTVRRDLTPKPAFLAAQHLIQELRGYTFRHRIAGAIGQEWRLLFQKGDSAELAFVTWSDGADASPEAQTPRIRKIAPGDKLYPTLQRLAALRYAYGPRADGVGDSALIELELRNPESAPILWRIALRTDGVAEPVTATATVAPGASERRVLRLPTFVRRVDPRTFEWEISVDAKRLPEIAPVVVGRIDALRLTAAPRGEKYHVLVENPSLSALEATVRLEGGRQPGNVPLRLTSGDERGGVILPSPGDAVHRVGLYDASQNLIALTETLRFVPLVGLSPERWRQVRFVENAPGAPVVAEEKPTPESDAPEKSALRLAYRFEPGWRYDLLAPAAPAPIPEGAAALTLWVWADGSGDYLRSRFKDAKGVVYQVDLGQLTWRGWKLVEIPLDGSWLDTRWGETERSDAPRAPLTWEALLLVDSSRRESAHDGEIRLTSPFYRLRLEAR